MKTPKHRNPSLEINNAIPPEVADALARIEDQLGQIIAKKSHLDRQASEEASNLEAGFKSRDQVKLIGCVLHVNSRSIGLSQRQALLVSILIRHALSGDSGFLTTRSIIQEVEKDFSSMWSMPVPADVHQTVYQIRAKLHLDRNLLESSVAKGGGLRISTPRDNLGPIKSPWIPKSPPE